MVWGYFGLGILLVGVFLLWIFLSGDIIAGLFLWGYYVGEPFGHLTRLVNMHLGSSSDCSLTSVTTRYCGNALNDDLTGTLTSQTICDCTAPFTIGVKTNAATDTGDTASDLLSRGVCLEYRQTPCGS